MTSQVYDLGHDFFDSLCPAVIKGLYSDEAFSDVTLISGDGVSIKAHRNIVASLSETLRNILLDNFMKKDFTIYLMDIDADILKNLKNFMYLGSAQIQQERLDTFLNAGTKLRINGLTQQDGIEDTNNENTVDKVDAENEEDFIKKEKKTALQNA